MLAFAGVTGYDALVNAADSDEVVFSLGWCSTCEKEVLTHVDYDEAGVESLLCVHCDTTVATDIRVATESGLSDREYAIVEEQGCGRPDCGGGRCRNS